MAEAPLAVVKGFPSVLGPIDLELEAGDVVHVRGGNGSGKTSLLRAIAGLDAPLRPSEVLLSGRDARALPAAELARAVRAVWSSPRASLVGLTVASEFRLRALPLPPALLGLAGRDVATLSSGEARRVALAAAAASPAPLLLLDEPCAALDADGLRALSDLVRDAARQGAVLIADHSGWAKAVATRAIDLGPRPTDGGPVLPGPASATPALSAPAVDVRRGRTAVRLPAVDLAPGFHVVTGRNGAGKSTLLQRLAALRDGAGVVVGGAPARPAANVRLLQPDAGDLLMEPTVRRELADAIDPEGLVPPALLDRHPMSLSAGEAHRVALVKALGHTSPVHLLDEPDAHLDPDARRRLLAAVARRLADGACVVAATHDAALVAAAHSRVEVAA